MTAEKKKDSNRQHPPQQPLKSEGVITAAASEGLSSRERIATAQICAVLPGVTISNQLLLPLIRRYPHVDLELEAMKCMAYYRSEMPDRPPKDWVLVFANWLVPRPGRYLQELPEEEPSHNGDGKRIAPDPVREIYGPRSDGLRVNGPVLGTPENDEYAHARRRGRRND